MNTALKLFGYRLKTEWKFQYQVFRMAMDWTVALYMVIPALVYGIYSYLGWWHVLPGWITHIPLNSLATVVFFFAWSGTIRVFLEEADQLFLIQCPAWLITLMRWSITYSMLFNMFKTYFVFLILAPFMLLHYHLFWWQLAAFGVFTWGFKNSLAINKQLLSLRFKGWRHRALQIVLVALTGIYFRGSLFLLLNLPVLFALSGLILLVVLGFLIHERLTLQGCFFEDVAREQYERMKLANLLLKASGYHTKKLRTIRKRPIVFRNSNLLFKERTPVNALVELSLKSVLRNGGHLKVYFWLLLPMLAFELAVPASYGWGLLLVFALILTNFVALFWRETINSPFVQFLRWRPEDRVTAAAKSLFLLALPGTLMVSLALGLKNYPWWEALGVLPIGTIIVYFCAKLVCLWAG